jgi:hypothetical protein
MLSQREKDRFGVCRVGDQSSARANHIEPKTSVKVGGFEAKNYAFAV